MTVESTRFIYVKGCDIEASRNDTNNAKGVKSGSENSRASLADSISMNDFVPEHPIRKMDFTGPTRPISIDIINWRGFSNEVPQQGSKRKGGEFVDASREPDSPDYHPGRRTRRSVPAVNSATTSKRATNLASATISSVTTSGSITKEVRKRRGRGRPAKRKRKPRTALSQQSSAHNTVQLEAQNSQEVKQSLAVSQEIMDSPPCGLISPTLSSCGLGPSLVPRSSFSTPSSPEISNPPSTGTTELLEPPTEQWAPDSSTWDDIHGFSDLPSSPPLPSDFHIHDSSTLPASSDAFEHALQLDSSIDVRSPNSKGIARPQRPPPLPIENSGSSPGKRTYVERSALSAKTPDSAAYMKYLCISPSPNSTQFGRLQTSFPSSRQGLHPSSEDKSVGSSTHEPGIVTSLLEVDDEGSYDSFYSKMLTYGLHLHCESPPPIFKPRPQSQDNTSYMPTPQSIEQAPGASFSKDPTLSPYSRMSSIVVPSEASESPEQFLNSSVLGAKEPPSEHTAVCPSLSTSNFDLFTPLSSEFLGIDLGGARALQQDPMDLRSRINSSSSPVNTASMSHETVVSTKIVDRGEPGLPPSGDVYADDLSAIQPIVSPTMVLPGFSFALPSDLRKVLTGPRASPVPMKVSSSTRFSLEKAPIGNPPTMFASLDVPANAYAATTSASTDQSFERACLEVDLSGATPSSAASTGRSCDSSNSERYHNLLSVELLSRLLTTFSFRDQLLRAFKDHKGICSVNRTTARTRMLYGKAINDKRLLSRFWSFIESAPTIRSIETGISCRTCMFSECIYSIIGFESGAELMDHILSEHVGKRQLICAYCFRHFSYAPTLEKHMRSGHHNDQAKAAQMEHDWELSSFLVSEFDPLPKLLHSRVYSSFAMQSDPGMKATDDEQNDPNWSEDASYYDTSGGDDSDYSEADTELSDVTDALSDTEIDDVLQAVEDPDWGERYEKRTRLRPEPVVDSEFEVDDAELALEAFEVQKEILSMFTEDEIKTPYRRRKDSSNENLVAEEEDALESGKEFEALDVSLQRLDISDQDLRDAGIKVDSLTRNLKETLKTEFEASAAMNTYLLSSQHGMQAVKNLLARSSRPAIGSFNLENNEAVVEQNLVRHGLQSMRQVPSPERYAEPYWRGTIHPSDRIQHFVILDD